METGSNERTLRGRLEERLGVERLKGHLEERLGVERENAQKSTAGTFSDRLRERSRFLPLVSFFLLPFRSHASAGSQRASSSTVISGHSQNNHQLAAPNERGRERGLERRLGRDRVWCNEREVPSESAFLNLIINRVFRAPPQGPLSPSKTKGNAYTVHGSWRIALLLKSLKSAIYWHCSTIAVNEHVVTSFSL